MIGPVRERRGIPLRAVVPNAVTALALCVGLTGVRFAIAGEWAFAVFAVVAAGVLDGLDGRIAGWRADASAHGVDRTVEDVAGAHAL